jgi:Na+/proline symporter
LPGGDWNGIAGKLSLSVRGLDSAHCAGRRRRRAQEQIGAVGRLHSFLSAVYLGLLFAVARFGDARADAGRSIISANVYALSLAVYCTSWTFYGSVGRATSGGLSFLTIYIGPTLMLLFVGVIVKMIRISKAQRITSIADFIASRYGKSQLLAGLVTVIAVIGVVPYIALQLKAVAASLEVLLDHSGNSFNPPLLDSTFVIAALLAVFTILFGTRHLDATERHEGMVAAIAFESVVKLLAFLAVGLFVTYGMFGGFSDLFSGRPQRPNWRACCNWIRAVPGRGPR